MLRNKEISFGFKSIFFTFIREMQSLKPPYSTKHLFAFAINQITLPTISFEQCK